MRQGGYGSKTSDGFLQETDARPIRMHHAGFGPPPSQL